MLGGFSRLFTDATKALVGMVLGVLGAVFFSIVSSAVGGGLCFLLLRHQTANALGWWGIFLGGAQLFCVVLAWARCAIAFADGALAGFIRACIRLTVAMSLAWLVAAVFTAVLCSPAFFTSGAAAYFEAVKVFGWLTMSMTVLVVFLVLTARDQ